MFNGSFDSIKQQKLRASIVQRWIDKSVIDKKTYLKKINFAGVLKVTDEGAGSETVSQRYRSVDLDPWIWIRTRMAQTIMFLLRML
jgi:hypothetical protein